MRPRVATPGLMRVDWLVDLHSVTMFSPRRFQAGCLYFGGLIYEDPKDNNRLYCERGGDRL